ncbi:MAG: ROK family protein, partial [Sinobacterium sp.]|nr:ROK family protein [Sinobacterium sp.]
MLQTTDCNPTNFRLGIDLGGTKIEIALLVLNADLGTYSCEFRFRVDTPKSYDDILRTLALLVAKAEAFCLQQYQFSLDTAQVTLGVGLPGKLTDQGLVQNSNTNCLNQQAIKSDLQPLLPDYLRESLCFMNDANCFCLSESMQGSAAPLIKGMKQSIVFGVILGTGVGGGLVINGDVING